MTRGLNISTLKASAQLAIENSRILVGAGKSAVDTLSAQVALAKGNLAHLARSREDLARSCEELARTREELARSGTAAPHLAGVCQPPMPDVRETADKAGQVQRRFTAVAELIEQIEQSAQRTADWSACLLRTITLALEDDADPPQLIGILLAGIIQTVLQRVEPAARDETVVALCTALCERVNSRGV